MAEDGAIALEGSLQENVLTLLCWDPVNCLIIRSYVPLSVYSNSIFRRMAEVSYDYIDKYKSPPAVHLPDLLEKERASEASDLFEDKMRSMRVLYKNGVHKEYIMDQLNDFIAHYTFRTSLVAAARLLTTEGSKWTEARELMYAAVNPSFNKLEMPTVLAEGAKDLFIDRNRKSREFVRLGIKTLDVFDLGPGKKELWMAVGGPKSGKSSLLLYVAERAARQRWKVLYVTLEMSEEEVITRLVQSIYDLKRRDADKVSTHYINTDSDGRMISIEQDVEDRPTVHSDEARDMLRDRLHKFRVVNRIYIKQFGTGSLTVEELNGYLDFLAARGIKLDMVIVDYPDLMKIKSVEHYRIALGNIYKDLRGIGVNRNLAMVIASQVNRAGASRRLVKAVDIGEDFSKIAISDIALTINSSPEEQKMGMVRLFVAISRVSTALFSVLVSQRMATSRFVAKSYRVPPTWDKMIEGPGKDAEAEPSNGREDDDEDEGQERRYKNGNGAYREEHSRPRLAQRSRQAPKTRERSYKVH